MIWLLTEANNYIHVTMEMKQDRITDKEEITFSVNTCKHLELCILCICLWEFPHNVERFQSGSEYIQHTAIPLSHWILMRRGDACLLTRVDTPVSGPRSLPMQPLVPCPFGGGGCSTPFCHRSYWAGGGYPRPGPLAWTRVSPLAGTGVPPPPSRVCVRDDFFVYFVFLSWVTNMVPQQPWTSLKTPTITCHSARFMTPSRELARVEPKMILIQEAELNVMKACTEVTRWGKVSPGTVQPPTSAVISSS